MPHVIFYNIPDCNLESYDRIKAATRNIIASIEELELNTEHVFVTIVQDRALVSSKNELDKTILVKVEDLYEKPNRTAEVKKKIAKALSKYLQQPNYFERYNVVCKVTTIAPEDVFVSPAPSKKA
jgi:hypothetical protein